MARDWERREVRVRYEAPVGVIDLASKRVLKTVGRNLSRSGIFIDTSEQVPVGTKILCSLPVLGDGRAVQVEGRVAWNRSETRGGNSGRELHQEPGGMGIEFIDLTEDLSAELSKIVETSSKKDSPVRLRLNGIDLPVPARAKLSADGIFFRVPLPHLAKDAEVDFSFSAEKDDGSYRGKIVGVEVESRKGSVVPELQVQVELLSAGHQDEIPGPEMSPNEAAERLLVHPEAVVEHVRLEGNVALEGQDTERTAIDSAVDEALSATIGDAMRAVTTQSYGIQAPGDAALAHASAHRSRRDEDLEKFWTPDRGRASSKHGGPLAITVEPDSDGVVATSEPDAFWSGSYGTVTEEEVFADDGSDKESDDNMSDLATATELRVQETAADAMSVRERALALIGNEGLDKDDPRHTAPTPARGNPIVDQEFDRALAAYEAEDTGATDEVQDADGAGPALAGSVSEGLVDEVSEGLVDEVSEGLVDEKDMGDQDAVPERIGESASGSKRRGSARFSASGSLRDEERMRGPAREPRSQRYALPSEFRSARQRKILAVIAIGLGLGTWVHLSADSESQASTETISEDRQRVRALIEGAKEPSPEERARIERELALDRIRRHALESDEELGDGDAPAKAVKPAVVVVEKAPVKPKEDKMKRQRQGGLLLKEDEHTLVLRLPFEGETAGAQNYLLNDPPALAINLPNAKPVHGFQKQLDFQSDTIRFVWVRERLGGLHLRAFFVGEAPLCQVSHERSLLQISCEKS